MLDHSKQRDLLTGRWRNVVSEKPTREVAMQIQLVAMLRWCLKPPVIFRHVPNGELRDARTAAKLKAMGILAGSADLEFFWRDRLGSFRAMFMELKLPGGKLSDVQASFGLAMKLMGAEYEMVTSVEAAIKLLGNRGLIKEGVEVCGKRWSQPFDDDPGEDDFGRSSDIDYLDAVCEVFESAIKKGKAKGGKGWVPP